MKYLIDTNVLVYSVDEREPLRMAQANDVLEQLIPSGRAVVSAQVLAEFSNVMMKNVVSASGSDEVYRLVEQYMRAVPVVPLTSAIVLEAIRGVRAYRLSYYDAQIWAAARLNQIPFVLSEDFQADATLEGVTFIDPFDAKGDTPAFQG